MIRGYRSNPRISNDKRPHNPGSKGMGWRHNPSVSDEREQDGSYGPYVPGSGCSGRNPLLGSSAPNISYTRCEPRWNHITKVRRGKRRSTPVRGHGWASPDPHRSDRGEITVAEIAKVTNTVENTVPIRYNTSYNVPVYGDCHKSMEISNGGKNRIPGRNGMKWRIVEHLR